MASKVTELRVFAQEDGFKTPPSTPNRGNGSSSMEENPMTPDQLDIYTPIRRDVYDTPKTPGSSSVPRIATSSGVAVPGTPKAVYAPMPSIDFDFVGRIQELAVLSDRLTELLRGGHPGTFVLEGPSGVGKSHLIQRILRLPVASEVTIYYGRCLEEEAKTPYYVWRSIFRQFFSIPEDASASDVQQKILEQFHIFPELAEYGPLLNSILPLSLPETDVTVNFRGKARADHISNFYLRLLQHGCSHGPKLIIIENEQWMDTSSWKLLLNAARFLQPAFMLISSNEFGSSVPPHYSDEIALSGAFQIFKLAPLSQRELKDFLCLKLQLPPSILPTDVVTYFYEKSKGYPLYAEELLYYCKEKGLIKISDQKSPLLSVDALMTELAEITPDFRNLMIKRLGNIDAMKRHTLCSAAVIGVQFDLMALLDVRGQTFVDKKKYSMKGRSSSVQSEAPPGSVRSNSVRDLNSTSEVSHPNVTLRRDLRDLEARYYISKSQNSQSKLHSFRHDAIRASIYASFRAGKKEMHLFTALWYEGASIGQASLFAPRLAHHWVRAKRYDKARVYFAQAADYAMSVSSFPEAIHFYQFAIACAKKDAENIPDIDSMLSTWEEAIGCALHDMGEWKQSYEIFLKVNMDRGLSRMPTSSVLPSIFSVFSEEIGRIVGNYIPTIWSMNEEDLEKLRCSARLHIRMALAAFYEDDIPTFASNTSRALRIMSTYFPKSDDIPLLYAMAGVSYGQLLLNVGDLIGRYVTREFLNKALALIRSCNDAYVLSWVYHLNAFDKFRLGKWRQHNDLEKKAIAQAQKVGDLQLTDYCSYLLALSEIMLGNYQEANNMLDEVFTNALTRSDVIGLIWTRIASGLLLTRWGRIPEAITWLEDTLNVIDHGLEIERLSCSMVLNLARCYHGGRSFCLQLQLPHVPYRVERGEVSAVYFPFLMSSVDAALQSLSCTLEENAIDDHSIRIAKTQARRYLRYLERFALLQPFAYPAYLLYYGTEQTLLGSYEKGLSILARAVELAIIYQLPYEEARAHFEISKIFQYYTPNKSLQDSHAHASLEIFTRLGCQYEIRRLKMALTVPIV